MCTISTGDKDMRTANTIVLWCLYPLLKENTVSELEFSDNKHLTFFPSRLTVSTPPKIY